MEERMIRPARKIPLPLVFFLLVSAAIADAECAWVMWISPLTSDRWDPSGAFQVLVECQQQASYIMKEWNENPKRTHGIEVRCLPDTVDPRGPKGK
jgi:hypothetical protein